MLVILIVSVVGFVVFVSGFGKDMTVEPSESGIDASRIIIDEPLSATPPIEGIIKRGKLVKTGKASDGKDTIVISRSESEIEVVLDVYNAYTCVPNSEFEEIDSVITNYDKKPFELEIDTRFFSAERFMFFNDIDLAYKPGAEMLYITKQDPQDPNSVQKFMFLGCPDQLYESNT